MAGKICKYSIMLSNQISGNEKMACMLEHVLLYHQTTVQIESTDVADGVEQKQMVCSVPIQMRGLKMLSKMRFGAEQEGGCLGVNPKGKYSSNDGDGYE